MTDPMLAVKQVSRGSVAAVFAALQMKRLSGLELREMLLLRDPNIGVYLIAPQREPGQPPRPVYGAALQKPLTPDVIRDVTRRDAAKKRRQGAVPPR